ncbi:hypothetical protein LPB72_11240 [Hydrogenophaga crassostreae]|uniref:Uncharacterized protein n=1 Tax=Hydrogenophaga crassostreae TaxID=1763535 RepID=A0ABX2U801_9BURK|nr:hypothetical protein [Hydrogenophaga crassostreae]OAD41863.1 hypothetical protein LPB72_11240 [Hydrogenophaga crassostreae]
MPFNDLEHKRVEKAAEAFMSAQRPPPRIRPQLDYEYTLKNQTIELLEVRPAWDNPTEVAKCPFAKATYVRSSDEWRVCAAMANGTRTTPLLHLPCRLSLT